MRDLDRQVYVSLLRILGGRKINVTKAAVKILEDSTFSFFIPQHAFDFMQGYCLTYSLLSLVPGLYVDTLVKIFKRTNNILVQKSVITALWFS